MPACKVSHAMRILIGALTLMLVAGCKTTSGRSAPKHGGSWGIFSDGFEDVDEPESAGEVDSSKLGSGSNGRSRGLLFGDDTESNYGLSWPLSGELSSGYGRRGFRFHHGIDIRARTGSTVRSAAPGVVTFAGWKHGYGRVVMIKHKRQADSFTTVYAHLQRIHVSNGDKVDRLEEIGVSGRSGRVTGPHLHFEVREANGDSLDPLSVIDERKLITSRH
jgi:murein DD-endopeptidase MepM/ murein hydrolase activator NlpD